MAHGARTWSNVGADAVVYGLSDMGELAARLGSPVTFNREGNVVWVESFEYGLSAWAVSKYGTGADVVMSAEKSRSSGYCCKMVCGSDGGAAAKIVRYAPYPVLGRWGLELSYRPEAHQTDIWWFLARVDGTTEHNFSAFYDDSEHIIKIRTSGPVWNTVLENVDLHYGNDPFHTVKLVCDLDADEYVRLIVNESEQELDGYSAYTFANAAGPYLRADIQVHGEEGYNGYCYIDDVILTQNESP